MAASLQASIAVDALARIERERICVSSKNSRLRISMAAAPFMPASDASPHPPAKTESASLPWPDRFLCESRKAVCDWRRACTASIKLSLLRRRHLLDAALPECWLEATWVPAGGNPGGAVALLKAAASASRPWDAEARTAELGLFPKRLPWGRRLWRRDPEKAARLQRTWLLL